MLIPKTNIKSLHRINDIGGNRKKFICLDKNERTVPFSKEIYNEMMASININDLSTYPDQTELYCALSNFYDLSEDHFLITPGSDAGIKYIFDTFVQNNCKILSLSPTYAMVDVYTKMFEQLQ